MRWLAVLILLGGAGYGAMAYRARQNAGKLPPGVQVAKVERRTLEYTISATGVVAAQTGAQVKIGAQLSGRIKALRADVGQLVKAGDAIAELDLPELQAQVQQAEDNREQAEHRYQQALINATLTREQTDAEMRQAEAALASADARLRSEDAASRWQPAMTSSEITRADAALRTAESSRRQVHASVAMQLRQSQAGIDAEESNLENLRRQYRRNVSLQQRGFVAEEVVDNLRTQIEQTRTRLVSARANHGLVKEKTDADRQAAEDAVAQARANVDAANAGLMQDELRLANRDSADKLKLQASAQLRLAQANTRQRAVRERAVKEAKAALRGARHQLEYQHAQQQKTVIRTPIGGTVLSIAAQQGETVAASFAVPTLIVVADLNRLEVRAYVDENDIGRVRFGQTAEVTVDSYPERKFPGRVTKIASASTIKDNVVTYETTVALDNPAGLLKPDMTTSVDILLDRRPEVLAVPSEAVKREGEDQLVYLLPPGQLKSAKRKVKTGLDTGSDTEILSGLKPGEQVVVAGLDKLGISTGFTQRR